MEENKIVEEFVVSKGTGKAFEVNKGQVLRVIAHEGKQVADIKFFNAHNYKEQSAASWSAILNSVEDIGGTKRIEKLYSNPPWEEVMVTVLDDKVGDHLFDGSCSQRVQELLPETSMIENRSCMDLFAECLEPYGIKIEDVHSSSTFNVWMPMRFKDDEYGIWEFGRPSCNKGDYIDFLAEMDLLVAATSCPEENVINDFKAKDVKYQIMDRNI